MRKTRTTFVGRLIGEGDGRLVAIDTCGRRRQLMLCLLDRYAHVHHKQSRWEHDSNHDSTTTGFVYFAGGTGEVSPSSGIPLIPLSLVWSSTPYVQLSFLGSRLQDGPSEVRYWFARELCSSQSLEPSENQLITSINYSHFLEDGSS